MNKPLRIFMGCAALAGVGVLATSSIVFEKSRRTIDAAQSTTVFVPSGPPPLQADPDDGKPRIRCAVIGGMTFTGFWGALAQRYRQETGVHVDLMATGPKSDITTAFERGNIDVITMHASDTMINLVANGDAVDAQPWMRNDLIIVGPPSDPAGIRDMTDAAAALRKIAAAGAPFVVHSSLGAQEVLVNLLNANSITLDPAKTTVLFDDQQRSVLKIAGDKQAYTLVGRIPFRLGRLPNNGLVLMVAGDPRLRRPYMAAVANPMRMPGVRYAEARRFVAFLHNAATQAWIAGYGVGLIDSQPLFFPVDTPDPRALSARLAGK